MIRIRVTTPRPLAPRLAALDVPGVAADTATALRNHWRSTHLAGSSSDGSPLPANEQGGPLGIGSGTIVDGWSVERNAKGATVQPFQEGRYARAARYMQRRGVIYHSLDGESRTVFAGNLKTHATRAIKRALGGGP